MHELRRTAARARAIVQKSSLTYFPFHMDRRTFIRAAASMPFLGAPLAAREKTATTIRRIGVLGSGAQPTPVELLQAYAPLRELGWVEGQNLLVERRYANGKAELLRPFAEKFVRLKVELIATNGTDAALRGANPADLPIEQPTKFELEST